MDIDAVLARFEALAAYHHEQAHVYCRNPDVHTTHTLARDKVQAIVATIRREQREAKAVARVAFEEELAAARRALSLLGTGALRETAAPVGGVPPGEESGE
jgi:hypothetical protein